MISFQNIMKNALHKSNKTNSSRKRSLHTTNQVDNSEAGPSKRVKISNPPQKTNQKNYVEATEEDIFSTPSPNEDLEVIMFNLLHQIDAIEEATGKLRFYRDHCKAQEEVLRLSAVVAEIGRNADMSLTNFLKYIEEDGDRASS